MKFANRIKKLLGMENNLVVQRYKENLFGKVFKWNRPINGEEIGEQVRCTNVREKEGIIIAEFSSGTPIDVRMISQHLTPCNEPSMIPPPPSGTEGIVTIDPNAPAAEIPVRKERQAQLPKEEPLFKSFKTSERNVSISIKINMPDMSLVRMMYDNASNKDEFLGRYAEFMHRSITADSIKASIVSMLEKKNPSRGKVKVIEND